MQIVTGVVEKILFKEIPPDKYDNIYRLSIKVGESWIGFGSTKEKSVKWRAAAKTWEPVNEGDTISVVATENGDFLNAKMGDIKECKKGSGQSSSQNSSAPRSEQKNNSTGKSSGGTDWAAKDAGAAASASIDKAIAYFALNGLKADMDQILEEARQFQQLVKTLAAEIQGKQGPPEPEKKEEDPKPQPKVKKSAPPPVEGDFSDDEIPFS